MNNNELKEAFEHVRDIGCIAKVHAETGDIIIQNQRRLFAEGVLGPEGHPLAQPEEVDTNTPLFQGVDKTVPVQDESGTRVALVGGTTMVADLDIPEKGGSMVDAFIAWKEAVEEKSCCDFALTVAVSLVTDGSKEEMEKLAREHSVNSFKMFMACNDTIMLNNIELK